ncbi:MAG: SDR family oxidoreductase [Candidatus Saccharibacteria bacterium]
MSKVILVTGATSGIGLYCAEMLAARGHKVYGCGRRVDETNPDPALGYKLIRCDINDQNSVEECINKIKNESGRIDVLVNSAGFAFGGGIEDTTAEEAKVQFETNYFGTHRMCREVMPVMRRQKGGMIINISSVASEFVVPFQAFYSMSKMAMDGLTSAIRMEGKPFGIIACSVNPGDVKSGFTAARLQAANINSQSAYYDATMKSIETMKRDEMNGMAPQRVAALVCRLVEKKSLKPKYFIETQYKAIVFLKRIMPASFIEYLLMKSYS